MTLGEALYEAREILGQTLKESTEDPSTEAGLLLSWVLEKDLSYLYAHLDRSLEEDKATAYFSVVQRRACHEPYAYITGECEFLSLAFEVNPAVLIPRADTELLAEAALCALGKKPAYFTQPYFRLPEKKEYRMLDVGTGSGCLAISLVSSIDSLRADALDISEGALKTAQRNAKRHDVVNRINFIHGDFLHSSLLDDGPYDLIVSNPPYIPSKDVPTLMNSVRDYEPHSALVGGEDGLVFYRALSEKAAELLAPGGILAVECGYDQALKVEKLFAPKSLETLRLKDLAGIERVVLAKK